MKTKLSILIGYIKNNDIKKALKLAASFPRLGNEKKDITKAWEAIKNPNFYKQIGENPEFLINNGFAVLKQKYIK